VGSRPQDAAPRGRTLKRRRPEEIIMGAQLIHARLKPGADLIDLTVAEDWVP
jgi:hypothetical protein